MNGKPDSLASKKRSRARLMPRAIAAGQRFAKRSEKLPYFQSATDAYMRGWMAGYRAHRNDVEPSQKRQNSMSEAIPPGYKEVEFCLGCGEQQPCKSDCPAGSGFRLEPNPDWPKVGPTQYVD